MRYRTTLIRTQICMVLCFNFILHIKETDLQDLVVVKDLVTLDVATVSIDDNIYNALGKITSKDFSILPVVAPDDHSKLLGVLTRKDILDAYDRTVIKKPITYE